MIKSSSKTDLTPVWSGSSFNTPAPKKTEHQPGSVPVWPHKYTHGIVNIQPIQNVYMFFDNLQIIQMQSLNRRHYKVLIPRFLYTLDVFNSKLIYWQFEQIVVYDVFARKCSFYES